jgi:uncharacterized protein YidB (DUF937 family)
MGILDQVIRSALGSATGTQSGQGRSPIMVALMALLASRALASVRPQQPQGGNLGGQPQGDLGGLGGLVDRFRQGGFEDILKSWIGTGENKPIAPNQLQSALGPETVDHLARETGMPRDDLLAQLSQLLPGVIDKLTPEGQLPRDQDLLPGPDPEDERAQRA